MAAGWALEAHTVARDGREVPRLQARGRVGAHCSHRGAVPAHAPTRHTARGAEQAALAAALRYAAQMLDGTRRSLTITTHSETTLTDLDAARAAEADRRRHDRDADGQPGEPPAKRRRTQRGACPGARQADMAAVHAARRRTAGFAQNLENVATATALARRHPTRLHLRARRGGEHTTPQLLAAAREAAGLRDLRVRLTAGTGTAIVPQWGGSQTWDPGD